MSDLSTSNLATRSSSPSSRYIVGIDLGTTTCSLAYLDSLQLGEGVQVLAVPQWERADLYAAAPILPSFAYLPTKAEIRKGAFRRADASEEAASQAVVGRYARRQAPLTPGRVVHAAKSWLCHGGVDRQLKILPWHSDEIVGEERLSPVEASAAYLGHLRQVWNERFARHEKSYRLEEQELVLTVPASFDEVASDLTLRAAEAAGFRRERLRLIEEPQAAFYYWHYRESLRAKRAGATHGFHLSPTVLREHLQLGEDEAEKLVLVCDIGGGTTDFSLLAAAHRAEGGVTVRRIAVSDHILLGGDNIDLRIAHELEQLWQAATGKRMSSRLWAQLVFEARLLKERALAEAAAGRAGGDGVESDARYPVALAAEGAGLFASTVRLEISRRRIQELLLEGFFPLVTATSRPERVQSALREWGLPYAVDSAVTRHLAAFLKGRLVEAVLYTGGSLSPAFLQARLSEQLTLWQGRAPRVLEHHAMELAVSQGAAIHGAASRYETGRIEGGYPRSLYVEAAGEDGRRRLICLVPRGFPGGQRLLINELQLKIVLGRPVSFQLYYANDRDSAAGEVLPFDPTIFRPLAPLQTCLAPEGGGGARLKKGQMVDVHLELVLMETGLLALHCVQTVHADDGGAATPERWLLQFNVQEPSLARMGEAGSGADGETAAMSGDTLASGLEGALAKIDEVYGKRKNKQAPEPNPNRLARELEAILGAERCDWGLKLLRALWEGLKLGETRRVRSEAHEVNWLNLAGYLLRPGYGEPMDRFRVAEAWPVFLQGMAYPKSKQVHNQWWIFWRRIAGGLTKEQQDKIYAKLYPALRARQASPEMLMLAGSLERIDMKEKIRLGGLLVDDLTSRRSQHAEQKLWTLARVASRQPLYGGPEIIVRPSFVEPWIQRMLEQAANLSPLAKGLVQFYAQAARCMADREFDISDELRADVLEQLGRLKASEGPRRVVAEYVEVDAATREGLFGESLPPGLILA